jgi:hypothetical protein
MLSLSQFIKDEEKYSIVESAASDKYERDVAAYLSSMMGIDAQRPVVPSTYADILVRRNLKNSRSSKMASTWLEVKMNHTDNLGNTRVSYVDGKWTAAKPLDPIKEFAIEYLTKSQETQKFLKEIAAHAGIPDWKNMTVPSTIGLLSKDNAVNRSDMASYFKTRTQYILSVPDVDLGALVTRHYLEAKAQPAHYLQAGDDFFMIGTENPLNVPSDVPVLGAGGKCRGTFKMRIGVRTRFYEVQPEIKILDMGTSPYSVKPGTNKKNPFDSKNLR